MAVGVIAVNVLRVEEDVLTMVGAVEASGGRGRHRGVLDADVDVGQDLFSVRQKALLGPVRHVHNGDDALITAAAEVGAVELVVRRVAAQHAMDQAQVARLEPPKWRGAVAAATAAAAASLGAPPRGPAPAASAVASSAAPPGPRWAPTPAPCMAAAVAPLPVGTEAAAAAGASVGAEEKLRGARGPGRRPRQVAVRRLAVDGNQAAPAEGARSRHVQIVGQTFSGVPVIVVLTAGEHHVDDGHVGLAKLIVAAVAAGWRRGRRCRRVVGQWRR